MNNFELYGFNRSLEPKNFPPQSAWKLNNSPVINDSEILIEVKIINVNYASFVQIIDTVGGDVEKIRERILEIVEKRGKLDNPVTGTGGILYGKVIEIGKYYPNHFNVKLGDEIILLASLTVVPLMIERIIDIDINSAQISVEGKAIIFGSVPIVKKPEGMPIMLVIALLDEIGCPAHTNRIAEAGNNVAILGAEYRMGILCSHVVRDKIGSEGTLVGIVDSAEGQARAEKSKIFDEIILCDMANLKQVIEQNLPEKNFDLIINCLNRSYTEMASILIVKNQGTVYFTGLANEYRRAALMAEALGKDINIEIYRGYVNNHVDFIKELFKKHKNLFQILPDGIKSEFKIQIENINNTANIIKSKESKFSHYKISEKYVFESPAIKNVLKNILKVARYDCTVLLKGPSGSGKELFAQIVYNNSNRNHRPFIKVNCAAIPEQLLESELFGYEAGSFTGANPKGKMGLWQMADSGVLFLDEIGDISLHLQAKLLRAIQEKEIIRIGGMNPIKVDVRLIAATNRNLEEMVRMNEFREDLLYRLDVFPIVIPPLSERKEDIIPLAIVFVKEYNQQFGMNKSLDDKLLQHIENMEWKGNIRELQNFIQRLLISIDNDIISLNDMHSAFEETLYIESKKNLTDSEYTIPDHMNVDEYLYHLERNTLKNYKDTLKTTRKIAEALGISQSAVVRRLKKFGL